MSVRVHHDARGSDAPLRRSDFPFATGLCPLICHPCSRSGREHRSCCQRSHPPKGPSVSPRRQYFQGHYARAASVARLQAGALRRSSRLDSRCWHLRTPRAAPARRWTPPPPPRSLTVKAVGQVCGEGAPSRRAVPTVRMWSCFVCVVVQVAHTLETPHV